MSSRLGSVSTTKRSAVGPCEGSAVMCYRLISSGSRAPYHCRPRDGARRIAVNIAKLPGLSHHLQMEGVIAMNHGTHLTAEIDQTDEDILSDEVSDETLEAAAGKRIGDQAMVTVGPTILVGSCC